MSWGFILLIGEGRPNPILLKFFLYHITIVLLISNSLKTIALHIYELSYS
jgi:hypothetical protein